MIASGFTRLTWSLTICGCLAGLTISPQSALAQSNNDPLFGTDPAWVESNRSELDHQFEMLTAAYNLDPNQQAALRQELEVRLYQQKVFEDKEMAELKALSQKMTEAGDAEDSPESKAAIEKLNFIAKNMPVGEEQIVEWMDRQVGSAAPQGHMRWEELQRMGSAKRTTSENELTGGPSSKSQMAGARSSAEAAVIQPGGEPLPAAPKSDRLAPAVAARNAQDVYIPPNFSKHPEQLDAKQLGIGAKPPSWRTSPPPVDHVGGEYVQTAPPEIAPQNIPEPAVTDPVPEKLPPMKPLQPMPSTTPQPPAQPLEVAPPLDDWDKYVLGVAGKYKFDEAQMTKAQSILRDLKRRTNQYRISRADAFARAQLITDVKVRETEMKSLNLAIDALFDELKQRLESLPTVQQRQGAVVVPVDSKKR